MSSILSPNHPQILYTETQRKEPSSPHCWISIASAPKSTASTTTTTSRKKRVRRNVRASAFWPDSIEMESIRDCDHLDQILEQAKQLSHPILVDWMAAWCRKCIYLKPKLEKLAVDYETKIKFYFVDVNNVPQALVKRGNISKMPTIQIWKDGEMKAQVIGGHKAWLVVEEVRQMIEHYV